VTPCSRVRWDRGRAFLQNVGNHRQDDMTSQLRACGWWAACWSNTRPPCSGKTSVHFCIIFITLACNSEYENVHTCIHTGIHTHAVNLIHSIQRCKSVSILTSTTDLLKSRACFLCRKAAIWIVSRKKILNESRACACICWPNSFTRVYVAVTLCV
jgi:hypothetical protein